MGEAKMYSIMGNNDYQFTNDLDGKPVVMVQGTFTEGELRALADAILFKNQDNFKFPSE